MSRLGFIPAPSDGGNGGGGIETATSSSPETVPNAYGGEGEMMTVLTFPSDQPALAFMVEGDTYPRMVLLSDATDAMFYLSDGTYDPLDPSDSTYRGLGVNGEGMLSFQCDVTSSDDQGFVIGRLRLRPGDDTLVVVDIDDDTVRHLGPTFPNGEGPVLVSPNETQYRLFVDDVGTLSAVVV